MQNNEFNNKQKGLWDILKPVSKQINLGYFLGALSSVFLILNFCLLSFLLGSLVDKSEILFFGINLDLTLSIVLVGVFGIGAIFLSMFAFGVSHLGAFKLEEILRYKLSSHVSTLPLGFIITNGTGSLKKVFLDDVKNLHAFVADTTPYIAKSLTSASLSIIALFIIDVKMALISCGVLLFGAISVKFAFKDNAFYRKKYEIAGANINKAIIEFIQAMSVVRTFDDGTSSFKRYFNALHEYKNIVFLWLEKSSLGARLSMIILSTLPTLVVILCFSLYFIDELKSSSLIAALFLSTGVVESFFPIMLLFQSIKKSDSAAKNIQEILAAKPLVMTKNPQIPQNYTIEFENVSFAYQEKEVLSNISFKVLANSTTAIVGASGAGKSTIAKLIPRFWDVKSGSIKIGGVDIRQIEYENLNKLVSFVFQDTFLFNDTILNNIRFAKQNASIEEVVHVCKLAQIDDFIQSLENSYDTKLSDRGVSLSGGQRQRITIARAILRNSPIIVLDEATAFTDPENEEEIVKALSNLVINKTLIVIAHRLGSIKKSSQIVVMNDGKIAEIGTHESLMQNKKIYASLWEKYLVAGDWEIGTKVGVRHEK